MTKTFCDRCEREIMAPTEQNEVHFGTKVGGARYIWEGELCDLCQESLKGWLKPDIAVPAENQR